MFIEEILKECIVEKRLIDAENVICMLQKEKDRIQIIEERVWE